MANVAEWMRRNGLIFNASKGEFMVISQLRHHNSLKYLKEIEVNQEIIDRVAKTKCLGLIIDENFGWKDQYKKVKDKVKGGLTTL